MSKKKILIIGGEGYIGSYLCRFLSTDYDVVSYDIGWYSRATNSEEIYEFPKKVDYYKIDYGFVLNNESYHHFSNKTLEQFDVIILLAGHSSVAMCREKARAATENNVQNFDRLLTRLTDYYKKYGKKIPIIYASSASVYGSQSVPTGSLELDSDWSREISPYDQTHEIYDWTKAKMDRLAYNHYNIRALPILGLRFGTVNGSAPHMRSELMLNSMVRSAKASRKIYVSQPNLNRPILALSDLATAIHTMVSSPLESNHTSGVYNLCSFNSTVESLAQTVVEEGRTFVGNIEIVVDENPSFRSKYNFTMNCSKFKKEFGWKQTITQHALAHKLFETPPDQYYSDRNIPREYP